MFMKGETIFSCMLLELNILYMYVHIFDVLYFMYLHFISSLYQFADSSFYKASKIKRTQKDFIFIVCSNFLWQVKNENLV